MDDATIWAKTPEIKSADISEGVPEPEWYSEHYEGDVQPIELMQAQFPKEKFCGGLLFNIIKYASRFGKKDAPIKDAKKILRYAEWLVEATEGKKINPRK